MSEIRVRYAPSPTGLQHIGGVRTALFNYFFARSQNGKFILRIEDTDRERYSSESEQDLYDTLNWLGIQWDEGPDKDGGFGPYVQSERIEIHKKYAAELLEKGNAYPCFCSQERLAELREEQKKNKKDPGYDRKCRELSQEEAQNRMSAGEPFVLRLRIPLEGSTTFHDELLGDITRKNRDVNPDPVIVKTDGFPTYHLANVIDDHLMEISHVLRAQEWIPSGPLHILLYEAFGWTPPKFCHLPMVMGKDGSKLSKRHGSTSVRDFRLGGYLPEAIMNYVSLLGWSYDDSREFFTKEEFEEFFTITKLNKAPAVFDYKKLDWFNGQYIRLKTPEELKKLISPLLVEAGLISSPITADQEMVLSGALPLIHERLKLITDAPELMRFLFQDITEYDTSVAVPKKTTPQETLGILEGILPIMENFFENNDEENEQIFRDKSEEMEVKLGQVLQPLRVALTGSNVSPPLFESVRLLGKVKTLRRLQTLIDQFKQELAG